MYEKCKRAVLEQVPRGIVGSPEDFKTWQDSARADDWQQPSFLS